MAQFLEVKDTRGNMICLNLDHIIAFRAEEGARAVRVIMADKETIFAGISYEALKLLILRGGSGSINR